MEAQVVVGFDLDMTLIDTVPGFTATLDALGAELGLALPSLELSGNLGPPLDHLLAPHLAPEAMAGAVARFRELYPGAAITATTTLPGAVAALAAVRRQHGRVVLVTGKYTPNAQRHVDHLGLDVDVVEGEVWGSGKGAALRRHGAHLYVGDHVHDVAGARAAGVPSVSVASGGSTVAELEGAGTDVVLPDLNAFPEWFDAWLLRTRLADLERIAYGVEISRGRLARVERAEAGLRSLLEGRGHPVRNLRVRDLGDVARVEVDRELVAVAQHHLEVVREAGFETVAVDPWGFRSGSMNQLLPDPERWRSPEAD